MGRPVRTGGVLAALPFAAVATLLAARWLPVRFEYTPNALGIVSRTTLDAYPHQQETFWLVFGLLVATLLAWLLSRRFAGTARPAAAVALEEALGAVALLGVLWLPTAIAAALAGACLAGALGSAARSGDAGGAAPGAPSAGGGADARVTQPGGRRRAAAWVSAAVLLAVALTPTLPVAVWNVTHALPDAQRVVDNFTFHGEIGQHLAWANALSHGRLHGKDFFCLYGPLYDLGIVGFWAALGRSIATWDLYLAISRVLALLALLLLGGTLLRHRALVLALPCLVPWVELRVGLALYGLLFLFLWLRGGRQRWLAAAGVTGGTAILYSQEFGLAFVVTAAAALALRRELRPALLFGATVVAAMLPVLIWYAAHGALVPLAGNVASYPGYIVAGYAKLAFPALAAALPLDPAGWSTRPFLTLQLGYALPAICVGGLLLALPASAFDLRRPVSSARAIGDGLRADSWRAAVGLTALFGLLSFRAALGRSDVEHMLQALPGPALLLVVAGDLLVGRLRDAAPVRPLTAWRIVALCVLALHTGFTTAARPVERVRGTLEATDTLLRRGHHPVGSRRVLRVVEWIERETEPGEPILFLPNNAAYYYLTDRPNPIRFVMGHQIVTQAHRDEALADLRAQPPRFVVWDHEAARVDGISDRDVFGERLLDWLDENYEETARLGSVVIRRLREDT